VTQTGHAVTVVHPYRPPDSDILDKYIQVKMWPVKDADGKTTDLVELRRDVSAERELERDTLRWHHHLDALSHISSAVSGLRELDTILNSVLDAVLEIFSGSVGGILLLDEEAGNLRYRVHRGLSADYVREMTCALGEGIVGKVAATGDPVLIENISKHPESAHAYLHSTEGLQGFISVPLKGKEKVLGVMNVASTHPGRFGKDDLYLLNSVGCQLGIAIEEAKLYQRLNEARVRYQVLLRQALTIQEEERKRIARELHDETAQALTGLALNLQAITAMIEMEEIQNQELTTLLKKTHAVAVHAGAELTRLIRELRPTLLDTLGLPAAIRHLVDTHLISQGIDATTEFKELDKRLPPETEVALFRAAQETISNIVRHSGASKVRISLEPHGDECVLRVEDNGIGFEVKEITGIDATGRGAGLFGIKERIKLAGGRCHIDSQLGNGTRVVIRVPRE
jgi:signal transduction histidine kinase